MGFEPGSPCSKQTVKWKKKDNWMGCEPTKVAGSTQVVKAVCEFSEGCCLTHRQKKVSLVCNYTIDVWLF